MKALDKLPAKPRAALYARVSTSDGRQTVTNQIAPLERFCKAHQWRIVARFIDQESGAKAGRQNLDKLMAAAARRDFDIVCVVNLDRLTREGVSETFAYLRRFRESGVHFVSMNEEHFRTTGPAGELLIAVAAWIAEQERRRHIERVNAGLDRARSQGKRLGRPETLGKTGAELWQLQQEANLLRRPRTISELAELTGMSKATVCRRLLAHKYPKAIAAAKAAVRRSRKRGPK